MFYSYILYVVSGNRVFPFKNDAIYYDLSLMPARNTTTTTTTAIYRHPLVDFIELWVYASNGTMHTSYCQNHIIVYISDQTSDCLGSAYNTICVLIIHTYYIFYVLFACVEITIRDDKLIINAA